MMGDQLRRLNENGIAIFKDYLADARKDGSLAAPYHILTSPELSSSITGAPLIERPGFTTKRDAAEYLASALAPIDKGDPVRDAGLWTWLALFFFDDICPKSSRGIRKPNANPHYILDPNNSQRSYRHLLATPYRILRALPDHNRIFLDAPLPIHGDLVEQTVGRLYVIRKPAVSELIDRLYFDKKRGCQKRGILNKTAKPGDLRNRLPVRIEQLEMTYDIDSLSGDQLLGLLGAEFASWCSN